MFSHNPGSNLGVEDGEFYPHERWVRAVEESRTCVTWLMLPSEGVPTLIHGSLSAACSLLLRGPSVSPLVRNSPPSLFPAALTLPICPRKRGVEARSVGWWAVIGDFSILGDLSDIDDSGRSWSSFRDSTTPTPPCAGISHDHTVAEHADLDVSNVVAAIGQGNNLAM